MADQRILCLVLVVLAINADAGNKFLTPIRVNKSESIRVNSSESSSCTHTAIDSGSIWEHQQGPFQSCQTPVTYPNEGASMCAGDPTSFSLDLSTVEDPVNCFVWSAPQCTFKWADVRTLQFDVEWSGCDGVWFSPVWANPTEWKDPQWETGEIDFVETAPCPGVHSVEKTNVGTSLNCAYSSEPSPASSQCADTTTGLAFGDGSNSNGPRRLIVTVTDGNMESQICNLVNGEASQCTRSAYFANFLADTVAGQKNLDMTFMSDVWNGLTSDQDCSGQPTHFNAHTQCKYTVWNMKVEGPTFSGKCAALSGV